MNEVISNIKKKIHTREIKSNIFATYFILFTAIFLVILTILGVSLIVLVNAYSRDERNTTINENIEQISIVASQSLALADMTYDYNMSKNLICQSLSSTSSMIDSDVFICDTSGKVVMCQEMADPSKHSNSGQFDICSKHSNYSLSSDLIEKINTTGIDNEKQEVFGQNSYINSRVIVSSMDNAIIGYVVAVTADKTTGLVNAVIKSFIVSLVACLLLAFASIWLLTRKMVTPLRQMSAAAKKFAVGDFSYRVNINGDDELSDLGMAFNDMADALDKIESSRRSFVANVSHELKTPMTSIAGFIDGILDGTVEKGKEEYYLQIVSKEVRRLSRLVVTMLDMSKIESGEFKMVIKDYSLSEQIVQVLLTFEQKIEEKNIEIQGLEDLEEIKIHADIDMIYQVIYNIVDNAVKFTNDGGYISVNCMDIDNDFVKVTITNSGQGIDSSELSKIFDRFYKVDKSRSLDAKSTGLGLYIVKTMVEMHGGKIYAKSDSQKEAQFVFTLPKASQ